MHIYFIRAGRGAVKIGRSRNVGARVFDLQAGNAGQLHVLRTVEGTPRTERLAHRAFAKQRIRGEWFRFTPKMLTWTEPEAEPTRKRRGLNMPVAPGPESDLLKKIMAHLALTGESQTGFGRRVMSDPMFINRLRHGRRLYAETVAKLEAAIERKGTPRESRDSSAPKIAGAVRPAKRRLHVRRNGKS